MPHLLRDHILQSLAQHPGHRKFHLHVLESSARRTTDGEPFPHARSGRPKSYVRDVLVFLGEEREHNLGRVLVAGIESSIYMFPQTKSVILYICKTDSTGHGTKPSATHRLVHSFIGYFCDQENLDGLFDVSGGVKNVWIQLFARSQSEYLFLGSKLWKGKRVLGDVGLCRWWKRCLGEVVKGKSEVVGKWYVLPGQSREEAEDAIRNAGNGGDADDEGWVYGHPYSSVHGRLPCPQSERTDLATMIPYFEDDPKSRFLDELKVDKALSRVSVDEFWERMSFRQECIACVTGFFTVVLELAAGPATGGSTRRGMSHQAICRVKTMLENSLDFSTAEKAMEATAAIETSVRGFCDENSYDDVCYGTVETTGMPAAVSMKRQRSGHVTELVVRRKKKARSST